jgi:hypothetical protein
MRSAWPHSRLGLAVTAAFALLLSGCGGGASKGDADLGNVPLAGGAKIVDTAADCSSTNSLVAYFKNSPCVTSAVASAAAPETERSLLAGESAELLGHGWRLLGTQASARLPGAVQRLIDKSGNDCLMIGDPGAVWKYEGVIPGDLSPVPQFWIALVRAVHRAAAAGDGVLYLELRTAAAVSGGSSGC